MYYCKALGISLLICFSTLVSFSQTEFTSQYVESKSYELYLQKDWKKLIVFADSAIESGVDYYYLRMRLGIANFELKKYIKATPQFQKAIAFNSFVDLPKEYLYYCLIYTERFEESRSLSSKFSTALKHQVGADSLKIIDQIGLEYGMKFPNDTIVPRATNLSVTLHHYVTKKVSFYHSFSNYSQRNKDKWNVKQMGYYLGATIPLKNNLILSGGFNYVHSNLYVDIIDSNLLGNYFVGSLNLNKRINLFNFNIGSTGIKVDTAYQFQHNVGAVFYPLANTKLSIGLNLIAHTHNNYQSLSFAVVPTLRFIASKKINLFSSYFMNSGHNIVEWNGFLYNNSPDLTKSRLNIGASLALGKKWEINATYQNEQKQNISFFLDKTSYNYNSIFLGIIYKP